MSISLLNAMLMKQTQPILPAVNQTSYAELDELAVPEFSRLYVPVPDSHISEAPTVIVAHDPEGHVVEPSHIDKIASVINARAAA